MTWLKNYLWAWSAKFLPFAIVDVNGDGHFWTIDEAVNAGYQLIFVKAGTHKPFTLTTSNVIILGAGRATHISNATTTGSEPCEVNAATGCIIAFMSFEAPGGGSGGNLNAVLFTNGAADNIFAFNYIRDSDLDGINVNGPRNLLVGNIIEGADADGIEIAGSGDNSLCVANLIKAVTGGNSIEAAAGADNCAVVGNIGDKAFTDTATTGTFTGNEEF